MATFGIHLNWTYYSTWLPGDNRGHWKPLFDRHGQIIKRGGKLNNAELLTQKSARERMRESAKTLVAEEQRVVAAKMSTLVGGSNQPLALAAAIDPTHIHLLLGPVPELIGTFAGRVKGVTSSAVLELPMKAERKRTWTAKYWKVFLFSDDALFAVKTYIEEHNLRKGQASDPYEWLYRI